MILSLPVLPWLKKNGGRLVENIEPVAALGLFVLTLVVAVSSSYNPFIYFQF
jgi:alginate O-acetyltransferase complex protein AlgI